MPIERCGITAEPPPGPQFWGSKRRIQSPQYWGFGGLKCRNKQVILI
jgi:hypothetical protein